MITIDAVHVCDLPVTRQEAGFPAEGDRGNALLLLAKDMRPTSRSACQRAGYICEGVCISACDEAVYTILEQLQLRYCPWPDEGFTLIVLEHTRLSLLADRLLVSHLLADPAQESDHSDKKEA